MIIASRTDFQEAFSDIRFSMKRLELAFIFGWNDVAQRYRRSRVGAFWLTISMGIMILTLGLVFGMLFKSPLDEFLPFICVGLILWGYISTVMNEGCAVFIQSSGLILQVKMPLFTLILQTWWRNTIILLHNIVIFPIILIFFWQAPSALIPVSFIGFIILTMNLMWMALLCAVICSRYRDMTQIVQNIMQVLFYATPIMWMPQTLSDSAIEPFLPFNPFYHLIAIVRDPMLGQMPDVQSWMVSIVMALLGWTITLLVFGRCRWRIPYWI